MPVKRCHNMPFGAQARKNGAVRFRLWAPSAARVVLQLAATPGTFDDIEMQREAQGWFHAEVAHAQPGMLYRYRIDASLTVPDPASRYQPHDIHGPSEIIDPSAWQWRDNEWQGRPWEEVVFYELHVGAFSPQGDFAAVVKRLDELAALGVTALQLMPVADFPGRRDWGYNGALPFAPDNRYGRPADLKALVEAAHLRGLMVFLDVVYNHFGPEGNYLGHYAPAFFSRHHSSPWGAAINFDGPDSHWVRRFFIENALYWLEEFHLDGLRLDAVHAIHDDSSPDFLQELAQAVNAGPAKTRHVHLVLENDNNAARYLRRDNAGRPSAYTAQWNDDFHHALHVIASGEHDGYYQDYLPHPIHHLGRSLAEGFAYQGEPSAYRHHQLRGEPSATLPPTAFVAFIQNHDQIGNRPLGERLDRLTSEPMLKTLTAILLLAPAPPLLFMGQEWAATQPFPFFCDFGADLATAVREGRRRELALMHGGEPEQVVTFDPCSDETFDRAILHWEEHAQPHHVAWLRYHRNLLELRHREIIPRLTDMRGGRAGYRALSELAVLVWWSLGDGTQLSLYANLGAAAVAGIPATKGRLLFATSPVGDDALPPLSAAWYLRKAGENG
jgi:maltooligosyltrehalose trehalohydrolase